ACATVETVVAPVTKQLIVAGTSAHVVVAVTPFKTISARLAADAILVGATPKKIVAPSSEQLVAPGPSFQDVITTGARKTIVGLQAAKHISPTLASNVVRPRRSHQGVGAARTFDNRHLQQTL
ncbi:MAG: hypothetical protein ACI8TX_002274, partial [Hyphomicrobiaceae bacterium]